MKTEHMPQLDGLRAFAVMAVVVYHFLPGLELNLWAMLGVKLFFVLSGFLIAGILLRSRDAAEAANQSGGVTLRQFYIRRFLRIFPLYYFVIAVAYILNLEPVREILPWLLTYTLNIHMAHQGWFVDKFAHFWTLAIEEQFYLVWPWLILFAPKRALIPMTAAFVLAAPLYRAYEMFIGFNGLASFIFTPASLDALCMGALLAVLTHSKDLQPAGKKFMNQFALPVGLSLTFFFLFFERKGLYHQLETVFFDLALALLFSWLVFRASTGFKGWLGALLESKPITYLGKISYGIYVYHPFMPLFWKFVFTRLGIHYNPDSVSSFVLSSAATLVVTSLSWHFMERPLNDLKRYFRYTPDRELTFEIEAKRAPALLQS